MEAANKGAVSTCTDSSRFVQLLRQSISHLKSVNEYVQGKGMSFSRLKTFAQCDAFVSQGGIGTLPEVAMIYQLVQVQHMEKKPIICVGRMWRTLKQWIEEEMLDNGF